MGVMNVGLQSCDSIIIITFGIALKFGKVPPWTSVNKKKQSHDIAECHGFIML